MAGPGREWGSESGDAPDLEVAGGDADLAAAVASAPPGALVRFVPDPAGGSALARAVGIPGGGRVVVPVDALRLADGRLAVNGVVVGVAPDRLHRWHRGFDVDLTVDGRTASLRATTVAVLSGQFWRDADLSPRGHPGDGVAEVQVYAVPPGQRRALRARLGRGAHLPHPGITLRRARRVSVRLARPVPLEVDGRPAGPVTGLDVEVVPGAYRLLV